MRLLITLGLLLTACSTSEPGLDTNLSGGGPTAPTSATASETDVGDAGTSTNSPTGSPTTGLFGSTTTDVSTGAPPTGDGPKLDLGIPDAGTGTGEGCTKIDFLFVVDNSNSMAAEQALLTAALPGFITAIQAALPDTSDYQIGVTKTDVFGFDNDPNPDPQNPCPYVLGGLLSHATPDGQKTGTGPGCDFASGKNFMTAGPTLAQEFSCAASVGVKGNTGETQAAALLAAVGPELAAPGACNEAFLRPDALLVVIMITDEDDDWSPPDADKQQNATAWSSALIAAKNNLPENVAFVLISGGDPRWPDCKDISPNDFTGAAASPNLTALATSIPSHSLGNVCQAGYEDTLAAAIATIATACESFMPPG